MDVDQPPVVRVEVGSSGGPGRGRAWVACRPPVEPPSGRTWEELELVQHWRAHLEAPGRSLRHVLD